MKAQNSENFEVGYDEFKNKNKAKSYFNDLIKAQRASDGWKVQRDGRSWDDVGNSSYNNKSLYIVSAIKKANELNIKPIIARDNLGKPVIYFKSPVWQISFHLSPVVFKDINAYLHLDKDIGKLVSDNKIGISEENIFDGIRDVKSKIDTLQDWGNIDDFISKYNLSQEETNRLNDWEIKQKNSRWADYPNNFENIQKIYYDTYNEHPSKLENKAKTRDLLRWIKAKSQLKQIYEQSKSIVKPKPIKK